MTQRLIFNTQRLKTNIQRLKKFLPLRGNVNIQAESRPRWRRGGVLGVGGGSALSSARFWGRRRRGGVGGDVGGGGDVERGWTSQGGAKPAARERPNALFPG